MKSSWKVTHWKSANTSAFYVHCGDNDDFGIVETVWESIRVRDIFEQVLAEIRRAESACGTS